MGRPVTLFTGQWADMPLEELAQKASGWGYDGLELACWGGHFDVSRALEKDDYCDQRRELLAKYGLNVWAISTHLVGQCVLDPNDYRTDDFVPEELKGKPEEKRAWAIEEVKRTAHAAKKLGVDVVNGFTGSSIWDLIYSFPPIPPEKIEEGFEFLAEKWNPILDEFGQADVKFALEVHPTEIAFDIYTAERALEALDNRPEFGFNFDPSHLYWQGIKPERFILHFPDRIYHVHMKDACINLDGDSSIIGSYLPFGDARRGWDFCSLGRGGVDFEMIIRNLNRINYQGPLSVEWEDPGMDREFGAEEACAFVKKVDFPPSEQAFDAAFGE
jgi:sugar phosphate isomerase/epimerase